VVVVVVIVVAAAAAAAATAATVGLGLTRVVQVLRRVLRQQQAHSCCGGPPSPRHRGLFPPPRYSVRCVGCEHSFPKDRCKLNTSGGAWDGGHWPLHEIAITNSLGSAAIKDGRGETLYCAIVWAMKGWSGVPKQVFFCEESYEFVCKGLEQNEYLVNAEADSWPAYRGPLPTQRDRNREERTVQRLALSN